MLTGMVLFVLSLLFFIFFIIYKKDMLMKMFSMNITGPASELRGQLEVTADSAIRRVEEQMTQLEVLLEEADSKALALDKHIQLAEKMIVQQQRDYQQLIAFQQQLATFQEEMIANLRRQKEAVRPAVGSAANISEDHVQTRQPNVQELSDVATKLPAVNEEEILTAITVEEISIDKRGLVLAMVAQGYEVMEIAKSTGIGQGEIQLLMQLRPK